MKKILRYGAQGLMAAAMLMTGASASAAVTSIVPTVDPNPGYSINELPSRIVMTWGEGTTVTMNEEMKNEDNVYVLEFKVNGEVYTMGNATAYPGNYEYGWWGPAEDYDEDTDMYRPSNTGQGLILDLPWLWGDDLENCEVILPEGLVLINGTDENAAQTLKYDLLKIDDTITTVPERGSSMFRVPAEISMVFGDSYGLSHNPSCDEPVVYGVYDTDIYEFVKEGDVKGVKFNTDHSVTFELNEPYTTPGRFQIIVPANYFIVKVGEAEIVWKEEIMIQFNVEPFVLSPEASWDAIWGPFKEFSVYASTELEFTGDLYDIEVKYEGIDESGEYSLSFIDVEKAEPSVVNGYPAITFTLAETFYGNSLNVYIPAGVLETEDGMTNADIKATYYLDSPVATPADGSNLTKLDKIDINWDNDIMTLNENCEDKPILSYGKTSVDISEYVKIGEETTTEVDWFGDEYEVTNYYLSVDFGKDAYTEDGTYTITIPAGYVEYNYYKLSGEIELTYTIGEVANYIEAEMSVDPASGSTMGILGYINVAWEDTELVEGPVDFSNFNVTLNGEPCELGDFDEAAVVKVPVSNEQEGGEDIWEETMLQLYFGMSLFGKYGDLVIEVKEGAVTSSTGAINKAFTLNYVLRQIDENATWTPESGASFEDNARATVEWTEGDLAVNTASTKVPYVEGTLTATDEQVVVTLEDCIEIDGKTATFDFSELADGAYTLTVPESYFLIGEDYINGEQYYDFTIISNSGITSLGMDENGLYIVYDLNGRSLMTTGNAADLKTLGEGIFIINGKKVIVRK